MPANSRSTFRSTFSAITFSAPTFSPRTSPAPLEFDSAQFLCGGGSLLRQHRNGSAPGLLLWKKRFHQIFHFMLADDIFRVVVHAQIKNDAERGARTLQLFLQTDGYTLAIHGIGLRQNYTEQIRRQPKDGISGPQAARHGFRACAA